MTEPSPTPPDDVPLERALLASQLGALAAALVVGSCLFGWTTLLELSDQPPSVWDMSFHGRRLIVCLAPLLVTNALTAVAVIVKDRARDRGRVAKLAAGAVALMAPALGLVALDAAIALALAFEGNAPRAPLAGLGPWTSLLAACLVAFLGALNASRLAIWSAWAADRDAQRSPAVAALLVIVSCLVPPLFILTDGFVYSAVYRAWTGGRSR